MKYIIFEVTCLISRLEKNHLCRPGTKEAGGAVDIDVRSSFLSDTDGLDGVPSSNKQNQGRRAVQLKVLLAGTKVWFPALRCRLACTIALLIIRPAKPQKKGGLEKCCPKLAVCSDIVEYYYLSFRWSISTIPPLPEYQAVSGGGEN